MESYIHDEALVSFLATVILAVSSFWLWKAFFQIRLMPTLIRKFLLRSLEEQIQKNELTQEKREEIMKMYDADIQGKIESKTTGYLFLVWPVLLTIYTCMPFSRAWITRSFSVSLDSTLWSVFWVLLAFPTIAAGKMFYSSRRRRLEK